MISNNAYTSENITNKEGKTTYYTSSCISQSVIHTVTFVCLLCQVAVCLK